MMAITYIREEALIVHMLNEAFLQVNIVKISNLLCKIVSWMQQFVFVGLGNLQIKLHNNRSTFL